MTRERCDWARCSRLSQSARQRRSAGVMCRLRDDRRGLVATTPFQRLAGPPARIRPKRHVFVSAPYGSGCRRGVYTIDPPWSDRSVWRRFRADFTPRHTEDGGGTGLGILQSV